ncbi:MAG: prolipoprotein diacylglyceryl transferase family protein [Candidatus Omnitrophota bacterium]
MYPNLFQGTQFEVASWELCLLVGFIVAVIMAIILKPKDFSVSRVGIFGWCLLMLYMAIFGAKLLFLGLHPLKLEGKALTEVLPGTGYASLGAVLFAMITVFLFAKIRIKRLSFLVLADYMMPFIFLHLAFVRIGCFLSGCCYGKQTTVPWGLPFQSYPPVPHHPTQMYSFLFLFFIYFFMRHVYKKSRTKGITFFGTLSLYGFFRFFVEFFRVDSVKIIGDITLAQITMLCIFSISSLFLIRILWVARRKKTKHRGHREK